MPKPPPRHPCLTKQGKHKITYATWDHAESACHAMIGETKFGPLFAYRAPCGFYHIGHS